MAKKKITILVSIFFVIFLTLIIFHKTENNVVEVIIPKGSSPKAIATILKDSKLIYSEKVFIVLIKTFNYSKKLKAGAYEFKTKDNVFKIILKIKNGENSNIKLTIPEGFDIKKIGNILEEKGICKSENFIKIATEKKIEGFLFPDTYFIVPSSSEIDIINMMNDEFNKSFTKDMKERCKQLNMSVYDIITLASIVEKEAVSPKERPMIAAIFLNRLKKKMKLESCATVLYGLGINKERLSFEDLKFESEYNTYKYHGLPPGPICNPGIKSIEAVLYPATTDNLFFVSKGNGTHFFSSTFNEHVKNKIASKKKAKQ
ncbi:MAG: endolytic transglycosylase MltG [Endomicrobiaceae bacterium]|nr:endolytic transglycosylase MltG [Endomicrobiaceae bacterium]MDD3053381.1 endolytic transglycosylase MltG [Endomicrobiaceae bacterium]MDD3923032.1 endolytic transglycosylase MltG [Endomicrobiaceae bacterium]MDD5101993.1 endolytic transglycosylase MltG [Endomicrobiaceae bacterium]